MDEAIELIGKIVCGAIIAACLYGWVTTLGSKDYSASNDYGITRR